MVENNDHIIYLFILFFIWAFTSCTNASNNTMSKENHLKEYQHIHKIEMRRLNEVSWLKISEIKKEKTKTFIEKINDIIISWPLLQEKLTVVTSSRSLNANLLRVLRMLSKMEQRRHHLLDRDGVFFLVFSLMEFSGHSHPKKSNSTSKNISVLRTLCTSSVLQIQSIKIKNNPCSTFDHLKVLCNFR